MKAPGNQLLCPSSLVSNLEWRLRDKGVLSVSSRMETDSVASKSLQPSHELLAAWKQAPVTVIECEKRTERGKANRNFSLLIFLYFSRYISMYC